MSVSRVASSSRYAPVIGFSSAVRAGCLLFVAGTTAVDSSGAVIGGDDPYAQTQEACARSAQSSPRQAPTCRTLSRRGCTSFAQSIGSTSGAPTGRSSPRTLRPRRWSSSQGCSTHACLLRSKPSPISVYDYRRPPRCACGSVTGHRWSTGPSASSIQEPGAPWHEAGCCQRRACGRRCRAGSGWPRPGSGVRRQ